MNTRICPTCGKPMIHVSPTSYICPTARTEAKRITDERRASVQATAAERRPGLPF